MSIKEKNTILAIAVSFIVLSGLAIEIWIQSKWTNGLFERSGSLVVCISVFIGFKELIRSVQDNTERRIAAAESKRHENDMARNN